MLKQGEVKARAADPSWPNEEFHTINIMFSVSGGSYLGSVSSPEGCHSQEGLAHDSPPGAFCHVCCDCHAFTGAVAWSPRGVYISKPVPELSSMFSTFVSFFF